MQNKKRIQGSVLLSNRAHLLKEITFQVFGGILMGCINGKSPLTEEDMNYIARNTAMEKDAVEVILDENLDEKVHSP